ncbi:family 7 glycosyl hydrolase [Colletotrichum sublineola]|uniref:Glucanase n=1 Tax=Colletotrichum sublineola TaxID=1173701 RepID=A0A066WXW3_COLSU|nr:family 7 glycosyl hydrolase [Colletotrichum sublineola]KDN60249.1 putative glycosyl hydrolase family 7 [Colletotrichum sublineola]
MELFTISLFLLLCNLVSGQAPGKSTDNHPKLETFRCTVNDGCQKQTNYIVADYSQHEVRTASGVSCVNRDNPPNSTACTTPEECASNCVIEAISDYSAVAVNTSGTDIQMRIFNDTGAEIRPRVYLLEESKERYEMISLTGAEFTFDVDMTKLPCGLNAALYLSEMPSDGGKSSSSLNKLGPSWGTGYCDAQCFKTSFINGVGNFEGKGSCCNELDIWEANTRATHIAPHPCSQPGLYKCVGDECEQAGVCDKAGCSWNPNVINATHYYGTGDKFTVDTTRKFTVVTQFPSENGKLKELRRLYVQDGKVIQNNVVNINGPPKINFMNDDYCQATGASQFSRLGGMEVMGDAMTRGMVLALSVWWDHVTFMNWLDVGNNGPCNTTEGDPLVAAKIVSNPEVTFSNIRYGEINSTLNMKL